MATATPSTPTTTTTTTAATATASSNDPFADHAATASTYEDSTSNINISVNNETNETSQTAEVNSTLCVGRNATLTLGTDSLIVLDEGLRASHQARWCGLLSSRSSPTRSIPYYNILWAECSKLELTIHYARPIKNGTSVRVAYIHYGLLDHSHSHSSTGAGAGAGAGDSGASSGSSSITPSQWIDRLLDRAYGPGVQRNKRIKVLINPFGGTGKAQKLYTQEIEPIFAAAGCAVDVERTTTRGHAVEIAEKLDIDAYDVLASASGDGLPYECFNGLGRRPHDAREALRKIAVVQLPCGSGNALSWNTTGTGDPAAAALAIVKGVRTPIDLVSITQGNTRTLSFLSQSLGIIAESDLGTDHVRWMGGARFTYGFLVRLLSKTVYPIEYAVREEIVDKAEIKRHYTRAKGVVPPAADPASDSDKGLPPLKYGTINSPLPNDWTPMTAYPNMGNFYVGNMTYMAADAPFFPASLPCDGFLDLVSIDGDISRAKSLELLFSVAKGTFLDHDAVKVRKVSAIRVIPKYGSSSNNNNTTNKKHASKTAGYFSVDGERYPFEPFQIEVHQALGTVLSKRPGVFEYEPIWDR